MKFLPAALWLNARGPQRLLYAIAILFAASAVFHTGVYALTGGSWQGAVSWRKPIEFSLSFAVATATLAWILGLLGPRRIQDWALALVYGAASVGEVALIALQRWRGTASHFNSDTPFDAAVFSGMGVLIILVSLAVLWLAARTLGTVAGDRALIWAVRLGLVFFAVGLGIGFLLLNEGFAQASVGAASSPITIGAHGALTLPHALALHALQVLLVLAWLSARANVPLARRIALVVVVSVGYLGLLAVELAQALAGSAPLDLTSLSAVVLAISVVLVVVPAAITIVGGRWRATRSA
jgi:hypothetical protein